MNVFEEANSKLDNFIKNNLNTYHKLRNYDFGVKDRTNVSQISKYLTHRILYEYEILEKLKSFDNKKKFTDEILWRLYWKGYLENYKSIWNEYKSLEGLSYNKNVYENAINGKTGIDCFDTWIEELKENNYLHNHSRMWFASIWIFTLRLPWQLGSRLFMQHLLDGDSASNTLSWRWVAGMHTNKKPYFASKENINKYTANRFKNLTINISNEFNKNTEIKHLPNKIPIQNNQSMSDILFMFDNDLYVSNRSELFRSYSKVYIIFKQTIENNLKLCENVSHYKMRLIESIHAYIPNSEIVPSHNLDNLMSNFEFIDVIYPGIGDNLDFINEVSNNRQVSIKYIFRREDLKSWSFARSGFYKYKNTFYALNNL